MMTHTTFGQLKDNEVFRFWSSRGNPGIHGMRKISAGWYSPLEGPDSGAWIPVEDSKAVVTIRHSIEEN